MLTVNEITTKLTPIFEQNGVTRAILFGSYAKGVATEDSDVDIVIETEQYVRGLKVYFILGRIIDALGVSVDLIPRKSIKPNSRVETEVNNTGRVIYER